MTILRIKQQDGTLVDIPFGVGADGKSAYEQAQEGGYTGTEEEFINILGNINIINIIQENLNTHIEDKNNPHDVTAEQVGAISVESDIVYIEPEDFEDIHQVIIKPVKSAYEYAQEGGYAGTEEEFAAELAKYADLGGKIDEHNEDTEAHQDIRELINSVTGSVESVNGQTGVVILTAADVGAAPGEHNHSADAITAGTLSGQVVANQEATASIGIAQVRNIYAGTSDMTAGVTELPTGSIYFVYEA